MSRKREGKLEQALRHELRAAGTPDRQACIDAETLAAWADGGLDAAQMASVEIHVSTCARCQAVAGATARSAPPAPEAPSNFWLWKWWLAPIGAAAAAVMLWMVVPEEREVPVATPPPVAAPAADTLAQNQSRDQAAAAPDRLQRANTPQLEREDRRERPAEVAEKNDQIATGKVDDANAPKLLQDKNAVGAAAQAPAAAAPRAMAAEELQKSSARLALAPLEIVSPDPSRRWRISSGTLERTEDSGTTWVPILSVGDSLTAGVAPSSSICWLIGRAGLVMQTADGVTFARVPLPERVDLTAITATDARSATVTTADGRRFRTDDSGRTWRQI